VAWQQGREQSSTTISIHPSYIHHHNHQSIHPSITLSDSSRSERWLVLGGPGGEERWWWWRWWCSCRSWWGLCLQRQVVLFMGQQRRRKTGERGHKSQPKELHAPPWLGQQGREQLSPGRGEGELVVGIWSGGRREGQCGCVPSPGAVPLLLASWWC
jgi:hypothetical protein